MRMTPNPPLSPFFKGGYCENLLNIFLGQDTSGGELMFQCSGTFNHYWTKVQYKSSRPFYKICRADPNNRYY